MTSVIGSSWIEPEYHGKVNTCPAIWWWAKELAVVPYAMFESDYFSVFVFDFFWTIDGHGDRDNQKDRKKKNIEQMVPGCIFF